MDLNHKTKQFLNYFIDDFDDYTQKILSTEQTYIEKILSFFLQDLRLCKKYFDREKKQLLKVKKYKQVKLKHSKLLNSHFVSEPIATEINKQIGFVSEYNIDIQSKKFKIHFITTNYLENFKKQIEKIIIWLKMLSIYSSPTCAKELNIYFYLTDFKKKLPENMLETLGPFHCNSAVTTGCLEKTDILIFRREEWFKVLVHETFHCFGLDFANYSNKKFESKIKNIFPLDIEFNVWEAYTEFWATFINSMMFSFDLLKDKEDLETFLLYTTFNLKFEQIFSLFQITKILNFSSIPYKALYEKLPVYQPMREYLYKEKTSVFSYYILKTIFLYNYPKFLKLCKQMNLNIMRFYCSPTSLDNVAEFIKKHHSNIIFLLDLEKMKQFFYNLSSNKDSKHNEILQTLRLSVI